MISTFLYVPGCPTCPHMVPGFEAQTHQTIPQTSMYAPVGGLGVRIPPGPSGPLSGAPRDHFKDPRVARDHPGWSWGAARVDLGDPGWSWGRRGGVLGSWGVGGPREVLAGLLGTSWREGGPRGLGVLGGPGLQDPKARSTGPRKSHSLRNPKFRDPKHRGTT